MSDGNITRNVDYYTTIRLKLRGRSLVWPPKQRDNFLASKMYVRTYVQSVDTKYFFVTIDARATPALGSHYTCRNITILRIALQKIKSEKAMSM